MDFNKALEGSLDEVLKALYEFTVLQRLEESFPGIVNDKDFFGIARDAVFNDMIARSINLFDKHSDSASLWYIYRCSGNEIDTLWKDTDHRHKLEEIAEKLKHVRGRTHFHIGKKGVVDTKSVLLEANIEPKFLEDCLSITYETLNHIFKLEREVDFPWKPNTYTGEEIPHYIRILKDYGHLVDKANYETKAIERAKKESLSRGIAASEIVYAKDREEAAQARKEAEALAILHAARLKTRAKVIFFLIGMCPVAIAQALAALFIISRRKERGEKKTHQSEVWLFWGMCVPIAAFVVYAIFILSRLLTGP